MEVKINQVNQYNDRSDEEQSRLGIINFKTIDFRFIRLSVVVLFCSFPSILKIYNNSVPTLWLRK